MASKTLAHAVVGPNTRASNVRAPSPSAKIQESIASLDDAFDFDARDESRAAADAFVQGWDLAGVPAFGDATPTIQRACSRCRRDDEELLQRSASDEDDRDEDRARDRQPDKEDQPSANLRPKLTISQPDDPYEREADQVADLLTDGAPAAGDAIQSVAPTTISRACDECNIDAPEKQEVEEDAEADKDVADASDDTTIAPKRERGTAAPAGTRHFERRMASASADGRPLPQAVRHDMERGFGQEFSHVRVHVGPLASAMCRDIRALAFTHRRNVYFNDGQFSPSSVEGRRLLAHELTHVVQQTGSQPIQPMVQRAAEAKIGNWAHKKIQTTLRPRDKKLITEAPIPGGTRDDRKPNSVGFADFYKAEKQTISGLMAQEPSASSSGTTKDRFYKYINMRRDWMLRAESESDIYPGPKIISHSKRLWDFTPNFPANFEIGELKPLFPREFPSSFIYHGTAGTAHDQIGNYTVGFEQFVRDVYKDNPEQQKKLTPQTKGRPLDLDAKLPAALNYRLFEQERQRTGAGWIEKRDTAQRLWVYQLKHGILVYFLIKHPYISQEFPQKADRQLQDLDPLLRRLRDRRAAQGTALMQKSETRVQRKGEDWKAIAKDWEASRRKWVTGGAGGEKPKEFLKKETKGVVKKAKVDKKLGLRATSDSAAQAKKAQKIRFWSSFRGRVVGALRFRFGHVFDKVEEFFDWLKAKFRKHHSSADGLVKKNGIFSGWKKIATSKIIQFAVVIFKEMLSLAFKGFISCINGIVDAILSKFSWVVDEAREEVMKTVAPVCCDVMEFKHQVEAEYKKHEDIIVTFTETIETLQKWRQILDDVETAVRIAVQIASCGLPPGLGCLWGLVAQLGISAGLSLLTRLDYFDDNIAKPAARALMDAIVGDKLHNFLIGLLEETPLKPFLAEASDCRRVEKAVGSTEIGGNHDKLRSARSTQARMAWEKENEALIIRDLQTVFGSAKGTPKKEDFEKLLKQIEASKQSPEEIKAMLEAARDAKSGKLSVEKAAANLHEGKVPEAVEVERKIDYDKATKANARLQRTLGWNPITFYPKPGITADSIEFANAVYEMQVALRLRNPDGILGEQTLLAFYDRNKLKKDEAYKQATKVADEKKAEKEAKDKTARDKAERERAEKEKKDKPQGPAAIVAVAVEAPEAGTKVIDTNFLPPGGIPFATVTPAQADYQKGQTINLRVLYYVDRQWVYFPVESVQFESMTMFELPAPRGTPHPRRLVSVRTREDWYFKVTHDSQTVYTYRGRWSRCLPRSVATVVRRRSPRPSLKKNPASRCQYPAAAWGSRPDQADRAGRPARWRPPVAARRISAAAGDRPSRRSWSRRCGARTSRRRRSRRCTGSSASCRGRAWSSGWSEPCRSRCPAAVPSVPAGQADRRTLRSRPCRRRSPAARTRSCRSRRRWRSARPGPARRSARARSRASGSGGAAAASPRASPYRSSDRWSC